jgi:hypothetical protein
MSVWSSAKGLIVIRKDKRVSVRKVIESILTDEFSLHINTKDYGDCYEHEVEFTVCMDGDEFCQVKDKFFNELGAEKVDLNFDLRFFK